MRKHYLDNIRWSVVLLVIMYHVFYIFNSVGVLGGVGGFASVQYQDGLLYFIYPWFMALMYLIAGISAKYALDKQSAKKFIKSRTVKLLVPSTLGLFAFQWIVGYLNIPDGMLPNDIPRFVSYLIMAISGIGPLWFIQLLWVFSLLIVLIRKIDKNETFYNLCGKSNTIVILLFALLLWGGSQILNTPLITVYRFGIYFTAFLLGYFVFSHDEVQNKVEKIHLPMLIISVVMGVAYSIHYFGLNYAEDSVLKSLFTNVYAWFMILAILGCGKAWFNKRNSFTDYMTKSSFGFYILHYLFTIAPCKYLKNCTQLPVWSIYIIALLTAFTCTSLCYELVKRIPILRWLVLGIKKEKKTEKPNETM